MHRRRVTTDDVGHTLANVRMSHSTPKNSVCHYGPGMDGRELKVWCFPVDETQSSLYVVKSVAWRDDDAD